jgi:hypothetical protein
MLARLNDEEVGEVKAGVVVQIDYHEKNDLYNAYYCRNEPKWQVCAEGKPGTPDKLKGTLMDWLLDYCEEYCVDGEPAEDWEEDEYSFILCSHCDDSGHVPKVSA